MNCEHFIDRLEGLLDGVLPADEQVRALAHAASCPDCRLIHESTCDPFESPGDEVPANLTVAILARTSGPTCGRAQERLGEHVDGGLDRADRELVDAHLRHCGDCAALATALVRLDDDLPAFAALQPDAELTAAVLARTRAGTDRASAAGRVTTLKDRVRRAARAGRAAVLQESIRRAGRRFLARPRIAWEAGCAAALAAWLVCGASWSPLRTVPMEALALVRQGAVGAQDAGSRSVAAINLRVTGLRERGVEAARNGASVVAGGVLDVLFARYRQIAGAAPDVGRHWGQLVRAVRDRDLFSGVAALRSLSLDAGAMLAELLLSPFLPTTSTEADPSPARRIRP